MKQQSIFPRRPRRQYTLADGSIVTGAHFRRLARQIETSPALRIQMDRVVNEVVDQLLAEGRLDPTALRLVDPPRGKRAS